MMMSNFHLIAQSFQWAFGLGQSQEDIAKSIIVDTSGNVISVGVFKGTADFDPGPNVENHTSNGGYDIFVHKVDASGNLIWCKTLGGPSDDFASSVAVDDWGSVFVAGEFWGTVDFDPNSGIQNHISNGNTDIFALRLDPNGNYIWSKTWGGRYSDFGSSISFTLTPNRSLCIMGSFVDDVDFNPGGTPLLFSSRGSFDMFILKLDQDGALIWGQQIGGTGYDTGNSIFIDEQSNVYATGQFSNTVDFDNGSGMANATSNGLTDIFILKLDNYGVFQWVKNMGGTGQDRANSIIVDASGNVYGLGEFYDVVDFDNAAPVENMTSAGGSDIFIIKLSPSGNFIWSKRIGGTGNDFGISLSQDLNGELYYCGSFRETVDFNMGTGVFNLTSAGQSDIYVSKISSSGDFVWAFRIGAAGEDFAYGIDTDDGFVYVNGSFMNVADFDPSGNVYNLSTIGGEDAWVLKLGVGLLGLNPVSFNPAVSIFPNPAKNIISISSNINNFNSDYYVFDLAGRALMNGKKKNAAENLDIQHLIPGVYILQIGSARCKFVKK